MQNQPYWDKTKREWVLEYKINNKDIGEYVLRAKDPEKLDEEDELMQMYRNALNI